MKKLIKLLGLKFNVTQYRFGRKIFGGTWYLVKTTLPMPSFWTDSLAANTMGKVLKKEKY